MTKQIKYTCELCCKEMEQFNILCPECEKIFTQCAQCGEFIEKEKAQIDFIGNAKFYFCEKC